VSQADGSSSDLIAEINQVTPIPEAKSPVQTASAAAPPAERWTDDMPQALPQRQQGTADELEIAIDLPAPTPLAADSAVAADGEDNVALVRLGRR